MDRNVFAMLCDLLKTRGGLLDDGNVTIEEQVATFVNILAHHNKNRSIQVRFYRSDETISRYVHRVLCCVWKMRYLSNQLLSQMIVRTRGGDGLRYHLQEWEEFDRAPRNHEEYFNMKRSQARNIIERCFGLLKKRWAILRSPSFYPIRFQGRMIIACALLHNFIRMYMDVDPEEYTSVTLDDLPIGKDAPDELESIDAVEGSDEWSQWRDDLAGEMFDSWMSRRT
ncbi:hypothetical protein Dsin_032248 [Dipteronia sinensis]|uniref:DDE Tnp4 domain-containing protein n=1 Tax=Dipteronia sinensis TaxID=43782 RepID=A0AAD9ZN06_9ROSI|nr:hypothetical protein Dsin_032248 [Dipteronia sinensis]